MDNGERVARFIDLLGYREITLKSDTEPAIIAFRNRVKGDKPSNGLIDKSVMLLRGIIREASRKKNSEKARQPCRAWRAGRHSRRVHGKKPSQEFAQ